MPQCAHLMTHHVWTPPLETEETRNGIFLFDFVALFDVRLNESSLLPSSVAFIQQHLTLKLPPEAFLLQLLSSEQQMLVAHDTAG